MTKVSIPDSPAPIFEGFSNETFKFIHGLKRNNNKEWFEKHREDYEMHLRYPMKALVDTMSVLFRASKLPFESSQKRSLFRINRDIRFSNDKSPYKTHIGVAFPYESASKDEWCGMYLYFEPSGARDIKAYIGGGVHEPQSAQLKRVRTKIADEFKKFEKLIFDESFLEEFPGGLTGPTLTRVPQGFSAGHQAEKHLKMKSFEFGSSLSKKELMSEDLPDVVVRKTEAGLAVMKFLV